MSSRWKLNPAEQACAIVDLIRAVKGLGPLYGSSNVIEEDRREKPRASAKSYSQFSEAEKQKRRARVRAWRQKQKANKRMEMQ